MKWFLKGTTAISAMAFRIMTNESNSTWLHRTLYNGIQYSDTQYKNNLYNIAQHNEKKELPI